MCRLLAVSLGVLTVCVFVYVTNYMCFKYLSTVFVTVDNPIITSN